MSMGLAFREKPKPTYPVRLKLFVVMRSMDGLLNGPILAIVMSAFTVIVMKHEKAGNLMKRY